MKKDQCGFPIFDSSDLITLMYSGDIDKIFDVMVSKDSETDMFNRSIRENSNRELKLYIPVELSETEVDAVHAHLQKTWFIPDKYKQMNLSDYLLERCKTPEEKTRVIDELAEFNRHNMRMLLRFMIYLVDFMKENNIVWGVGRGSSVSSYVLFLIGVHKIDSLKYELDFKEFMR
jgi:DNA polymerase III alpha subunit